MHPDAYLSRIGFEGTPTPTLDTLCQLQQRHLLSVPWENLDIMRNTPLSLEIPALYEKIVIRRRGGYCFELNALFAWLLREIGFTVTEHFARYLRNEPALPKRRHRTLGVECAGKLYLCDVGVGEPIPRTPMLLRAGTMLKQHNEQYKITRDPNLGYVLTEYRKDAWLPVYAFTTEPAIPEDFTAISYYCETHPASFFRSQDMVHRFTPDGRKTIAGRTFRHHSKNGTTGYEVRGEGAYRRLLLREFGIGSLT